MRRRSFSQQALRDSSYAPYARTMKKICWEESVHIMHGRDVVLTMMNGTDAQRALVQDALNRWWGPLMQMHGPPTDPATDRDLIWRIKAKGNEQLRQEFLSIYVPRIWELGLTVPDPELRHDEAEGRWTTPSRTGTSCAPSSPATDRSRRSGCSSAATPRDVDPVGPRRDPGPRREHLGRLIPTPRRRLSRPRRGRPGDPAGCRAAAVRQTR